MTRVTVLLDAGTGAWRQALDVYLDYRRQGGYAQAGEGKLAEYVLGLIAQQKIDEIDPFFAQLMNDPASSASRKQVVRAMAAIFSGSRDTTLADVTGALLHRCDRGFVAD